MSKLKQIIGFEPNREMKRLILQQAREEKKSVEEIAALYELPPMFMEHDGFIQTEFGRMTSSEYVAKYRKDFQKPIVILTTRSHDKKISG
jgi:hypothetical protein